jgi:repressor LexA
MNEAGINSDDLVLVRQQQDADNGDRVVALVDGEATIKEFHRTPDAVALRPRSNDNRYQPIIVTEDFQIQGVIVSVVPCTEAVSHAEEH